MEVEVEPGQIFHGSRLNTLTCPQVSTNPSSSRCSTLVFILSSLPPGSQVSSRGLVNVPNRNQDPALCLSGSSSVVPVPGTFSWPLVPRGKPRRGMLRRAVFSDLQRKALEKTFQKQKYISKPERKKLAAKLGLKDAQVAPPTVPGSTSACWPGLTRLCPVKVKIWFQNRRMKWRNSKERELLSTGGCRQQTLPTKTNPHPDLTDVGSSLHPRPDGSAVSSPRPRVHQRPPPPPPPEGHSQEISLS